MITPPERKRKEPNRGLPIYLPESNIVLLPVYKCGYTSIHGVVGRGIVLKSFSDLIYYDGVEKVTMVRNPFDRVVSLWTCGNNNIDSLHQPGNSPTFEKFVENIEWLLANGWNDGHYCPLVDYLSIKGEFMPDTVFKLENINEFIDYIPELEGALPKKNASLSRQDYREYYQDQKLIKKVASIYQKDLDKFEYEF